MGPDDISQPLNSTSDISVYRTTPTGTEEVTSGELSSSSTIKHLKTHLLKIFLTIL